MANKQEIADRKKKYKYPINKISIWSTSNTELLIENRRLFSGSVFQNHTFLSWLLGLFETQYSPKQTNPQFQQRTKTTEASIFIDWEELWAFITLPGPYSVVPLLRTARSLWSLVKMRMLRPFWLISHVNTAFCWELVQWCVTALSWMLLSTGWGKQPKPVANGIVTIKIQQEVGFFVITGRSHIFG